MSNKKKRKSKRVTKDFAPYHSQFEKDLHNGPLQKLLYEPIKIRYTITKLYTPDFVPNGNGYVIEAKGYFRTSEEARKYIEVKRSNPTLKIVFIIPNPDKKFPGAKKRKDGTFRSMGEWCAEHGFECYKPDEIPRKYRR